jgi:acetyl-CoA acetyltransferase
MDLYGYMARWHMARYGTTVEQLAIAASKNHYHSTMNPKAQYQFPVSVEQVLNDTPVSWPLTRSMCAPVGDGASSAIICSREFLEQLPKEVQKRAVRLAATCYQSGDNSDFDAESHHVRRTAKQAYEVAGLTPDDIDVAEVHDATIIGEIMQIENVGFCPIGEGGRFTESGATTLGGKIPVNPSGGMVSRGHPVSASGLGMVAELVTQLRGEAGARQVNDAKYALCENSGGMIHYKDAAVTITILAKD